ncbi:hypothetical protein BD769DRAFT_1771340 [Suillus cothurnatus]|nr:hypothetical protein BD769DRAFT_1771340 [Suillus cothurnatus]
MRAVSLLGVLAAFLGCVVFQNTSQIPLLHTQGFLAVSFPQVDSFLALCLARIHSRLSLAPDEFLNHFHVDPADIFACTARQKPKQITAKTPGPPPTEEIRIQPPLR